MAEKGRKQTGHLVKGLALQEDCAGLSPRSAICYRYALWSSIPSL